MSTGDEMNESALECLYDSTIALSWFVLGMLLCHWRSRWRTAELTKRVWKLESENGELEARLLSVRLQIRRMYDKLRER